MRGFYFAVGEKVVQHRDVTDAAVTAFAEISGDRSPNHVGENEMAASPYRGRIGHGAYRRLHVRLFDRDRGAGFRRARDRNAHVPRTGRIRFVGPALIGDRLTLQEVIRPDAAPSPQSRCTTRAVT